MQKQLSRLSMMLDDVRGDVSGFLKLLAVVSELKNAVAVFVESRPPEETITSHTGRRWRRPDSLEEFFLVCEKDVDRRVHRRRQYHAFVRLPSRCTRATSRAEITLSDFPSDLSRRAVARPLTRVNADLHDLARVRKTLGLADHRTRRTTAIADVREAEGFRNTADGHAGSRQEEGESAASTVAHVATTLPAVVTS